MMKMHCFQCIFIFKKKKLIRLRLLLFIFILFPILNQAQPVGQIVYKGGRNVDLFFIRLSDYDNGVTLDDFTTFGINYDDPGATTSGWRLKAKARTVIEASFSAQTLDPNVIELRVNQGGVETTYILSTVFQVIASGPEISSHSEDIIISYDIGKTNPITTVSDDVFRVIIDFELEAIP